ncbi:hypothetical protein SLEP1_g28513 [Rubroshorea leprosula]|uniref:Uncharacterized protein n=1 Tax=Rubroshorea leprosula TaxID=152421 RepID=A0AAV5K586_9ROSI|nr:hypothetical protein SLEP1_g28513 [Rubroshorea leprosula]
MVSDRLATRGAGGGGDRRGSGFLGGGSGGGARGIDGAVGRERTRMNENGGRERKEGEGRKKKKEEVRKSSGQTVVMVLLPAPVLEKTWEQ